MTLYFITFARTVSGPTGLARKQYVYVFLRVPAYMRYSPASSMRLL